MSARAQYRRRVLVACLAGVAAVLLSVAEVRGVWPETAVPAEAGSARPASVSATYIEWTNVADGSPCSTRKLGRVVPREMETRGATQYDGATRHAAADATTVEGRAPPGTAPPNAVQSAQLVSSLPSVFSVAANTAAQGADEVAAATNKIYSARVLQRMADEPGPFHNFPGSFDETIFSQGAWTVNPGYFNKAKPNLSNDSVLYRLPGEVNGLNADEGVAARSGAAVTG